jgi:hypothetical protein
MSSLKNQDLLKYLTLKNKQNNIPIAKYNYQLHNTIQNKVNFNTSNIPPLYYTSPSLCSMYNINPVPPTNSTRKVIVATIVAFSNPNVKSELNTYWQSTINYTTANIIPTPTLNVYTMPNSQFNAGWGLEESLDIQMIATANPNANIWVVEAKSASFTDLMAAVNYAASNIKADVISMSWGASDGSYVLPYNNNFNNSNVCYCASTGDTNTVSWPAVLGNIIAVGGTSLFWNTNDTRLEYTWTAAGCGYSNTTATPFYQSNIRVNGVSLPKRTIPDLSLVGNPRTSVYVYNSTYGWLGVGGTSASAPLFAGILSLAIQNRLNNGKSVLTSTTTPNNVQNYLYNNVYNNSNISQANSYPNVFYDVINGTNLGSNINGSLITFNTGSKFDIPSGLGSPNASNLVTALFNI